MASIVQLVGLAGASLFGCWAVCMFAFTLATPFLGISLVRNIRAIARELQRANDYREHYDHGVRSGPLGT